MVPVMNNAPYHHICGIPPFARFFKNITVNLMKEHGVYCMLLLLTNYLISLLPEQYNRTINNRHLRITFNKENLQKIKTISNALETPSSEELKFTTVVWLKRHKPEVFFCNMEKSVEDYGGKVLWTPPYCPYFQPIGVYWLAEKVNFSRNYYFLCSFKSTVFSLRYGWYSDSHCTPSGKMDMRVPEDKYPDFLIKVRKVDRFKLIKKSIKCANGRIAANPVISGSVDRDLHINADYHLPTSQKQSYQLTLLLIPPSI